MDIGSLTNIYHNKYEDENEVKSLYFKRMVYWAKKLNLPQDIFRYTFVFKGDLTNNSLEYFSQYRLIGIGMSKNILNAISEIGDLLSILRFMYEKEDSLDYDLKNPNFVKNDNEELDVQLWLNNCMNQCSSSTSAFSNLFQNCKTLSYLDLIKLKPLPQSNSIYSITGTYDPFDFSMDNNSSIDISAFFNLTYPIINDKIENWPKVKIENKKLVISLV